MSKAENPFAFPMAVPGDCMQQPSDGMTMLDYMAAAALQAMISSEDAANGYYEPDWAAERSYNFAEAMLRERAKRLESRS